jgi:hypothetical protein
MKQRITVEDLNQLTDEQKQRLRDWWKPESYDRYASETATGELKPYGVYHWCENPEIQVKDKRFPLISIGQMIELLLNREPRHGFDYDFAKCSFTKDDEICDRLWNAVKEVL